MFLMLQGPNGEPVTAQCDALGNLLVTTSSAPTATVTLEPSTASNSTAYEAARVLKASSGTLRSCFIQLDPTLATAIYYVQLIRDSAIPGDGAVTFLRPPFAVDHTNGDVTQFYFDEGVAGMVFTGGCVACVSSTQFSKTGVANAALFAGSVL